MPYKVKDQEKVDAFRLLKSLKRGDEVWVRQQGEDQLMFVVRELNVSSAGDFAKLDIPAWEYANIHVSPGLGDKATSISVYQQVRKEDELPYIVGKLNDKKVRVVEIGPELYGRMDELVANYSNAKAYHNALKNMISKRAKQAPEDALL